MMPPIELNVLDQKGGFTVRMHSEGTRTRPGDLLNNPIGILERYIVGSALTRAEYRVRGYGWPVVCLFDNETGERVA